MATDQKGGGVREGVYDDLEEEGCIQRCYSTLAKIPLSALAVLVLISAAVITSCVSVSLAAWRARDQLQLHTEFSTFLPIWLGCTLGTFAVALLLLLIATATSQQIKEQQQQSEWFADRKTNRRKSCLTILNGISIGLLVILQSLWLLIAVGLGTILLMFRHWNITQLNKGCIRLANYGLPITAGPMCSKELQVFYAKLEEEDVFLKIFIGFIACTVVTPALSFYMIYTTSNLMKLDGSGSDQCKVKDGEVKHTEVKDEHRPNNRSAPDDSLLMYRTETPL